MAPVLELEPVFLTGGGVGVVVAIRVVEAAPPKVEVALAIAEDSGPGSKVSEMKSSRGWGKPTSLLLR